MLRTMQNISIVLIEFFFRDDNFSLGTKLVFQVLQAFTTSFRHTGLKWWFPTRTESHNAK